jgi:D-sedoheptulose 7-phosphate isomerase
MTSAVGDLIRRLPNLAPTRDSIEQAIGLAIGALRGGGKLLVCGNGGSASDSEHLVADLVKGFMSPRPISAADREPLIQMAGARGADIADRLQGSLAATSLVSQAALATAISNDVHFDMVFAQQVFGLGQPGDVLVAISTSGASPSVLNAAVVARARSMAVIALTGRDGGELAGLADVAIRVPADRVYEIQELHLPVYHAFALALEQEFFATPSDGADQAQLRAPIKAGGP